MDYTVGTVCTGKISKITVFGAFVLFDDGKTGLCHVSEIADGYIRDISQYVKEGQEVQVRVIGVDDKGRISLSIKKAVEKEPPVMVSHSPAPEYVPPRSTEGNSFEEMMSRFKKESEERISDRNRQEGRRNGSIRKH